MTVYSMTSYKTMIVQRLLRMMARAVVWRHRPTVVAVTGSVGKTTTRDMIAHVLGATMDVRVPQKNFNNEIGVPLTMIGARGAIRSVRDVWAVMLTWVRTLCARTYPRVVIVECGVDRPGDMRYLMSIVQPDIAVVTVIASAHRAFFSSTEAIAREKYTMVRFVKKNGLALLCADDRYVRVAPQPDASVTVRLYGEDAAAYYRATDSGLCADGAMCTVGGVSFKLNYDGKVIPVRLHHVCAVHAIPSAVAALGVADWLHCNVVEAASRIADFVGTPGRMRLLDGAGGVRIIDDTYNASPSSMRAAIATLAALPTTGRRIAVLGDMLELGDVCASAHRAVADVLHQHAIDGAIVVGAHMRRAVRVLHAHGWEERRVIHVDTPHAAADAAMALVQAGDTVLVKGSQGMRMEKVVERLMPSGADIATLLCRQDAEWRTRPFHLHDEPCGDTSA